MRRMRSPALTAGKARVRRTVLGRECCMSGIPFFNLKIKPLEIDLLVIKKDPLLHLENEIGDLFKGHNMMEGWLMRERLTT